MDQLVFKNVAPYIIYKHVTDKMARDLTLKELKGETSDDPEAVRKKISDYLVQYVRRNYQEMLKNDLDLSLNATLQDIDFLGPKGPNYFKPQKEIEELNTLVQLEKEKRDAERREAKRRIREAVANAPAPTQEVQNDVAQDAAIIAGEGLATQLNSPQLTEEDEEEEEDEFLEAHETHDGTSAQAATAAPAESSSTGGGFFSGISNVVSNAVSSTLNTLTGRESPANTQNANTTRSPTPPTTNSTLQAADDFLRQQQADDLLRQQHKEAAAAFLLQQQQRQAAHNLRQQQAAAAQAQQQQAQQQTLIQTPPLVQTLPQPQTLPQTLPLPQTSPSADWNHSNNENFNNPVLLASLLASQNRYTGAQKRGRKMLPMVQRKRNQKSRKAQESDSEDASDTSDSSDSEESEGDE